MVNLFLNYTKTQYKENLKNWDGTPESFEVRWMIGRIGHWCSCISSALTSKLNECGWQFMEGDENCKIYDQYQGLEKLERLITYMVSKIIREKKLSGEGTHYCWGLVCGFSRFKWDWDFISQQDQETMEKIYKKYLTKFEELCKSKKI